MLEVACHHLPWTAHTVDRSRAWHDITALGLHARSNDVGRDMPSQPLDSTLGRTTFGVACHHCGWAAHTIERRRVWHDITSLGMHAWLDDVGRGISSCRWTAHSVGNVGRGMTSPPLDCTHGRTTSGVTSHHRLWTTHSVERRLVWLVIIAVGQHTRSNDVGRGMISPPLECTHGRTTSGVACHHRA